MYNNKLSDENVSKVVDSCLKHFLVYYQQVKIAHVIWTRFTDFAILI